MSDTTMPTLVTPSTSGASGCDFVVAPVASEADWPPHVVEVVNAVNRHSKELRAVRLMCEGLMWRGCGMCVFGADSMMCGDWQSRCWDISGCSPTTHAIKQVIADANRVGHD